MNFFSIRNPRSGYIHPQTKQAEVSPGADPVDEPFAAAADGMRYLSDAQIDVAIAASQNI